MNDAIKTVQDKLELDVSTYLSEVKDEIQRRKRNGKAL